MAPPSYSDLGKEARGIFSKGFHFGLWQLDCKTKTSSGIEFKTSGVSNQEKNKVSGAIESKYYMGEFNLTLVNKWTTDNDLSADITVDKLVDGLKLGLSGTIGLNSGDKKGKLKASFAHDQFKFDSSCNIDSESPIIHASIVAGQQGCFGGYSTGYDTAGAKLTGHNLVACYTTPELIVHATANDSQDVTGSVYHKVNGELSAAVQVAYSAESGESKFGVGCHYTIDGDSSCKAKVNNALHVGLAYQQKLHDGVNLYLSTLIDGQNISGSGHKVGVALELEG